MATFSDVIGRSYPDTGSIVKRICNCRTGSINYQLTDGLGAKRTALLIAAFKLNPDISNILTAWNLVLHK